MTIHDAIALSGAKLSPATQKKLDDWRAGKRLPKPEASRYVIRMKDRPDLKTE